MKKIETLKLRGKLTPLTKDQENQLKGGFGDIDTTPIKPFGTNTNCTSANDKRSCDNYNCACTCSQS